MKGHDFTIYDMIARNAGLYPEKSALVYGDDRISFSDYKKFCDQCAAGLIRQGVGVGDRIAVLSSNSDKFLILCGAAAKLGSVVVAVNCRLSEGEVEYVLKDATPKCLFSSKEYLELARKASSSTGSVRNRYVFKADSRESDFIPFEALFLDEKIEQVDAVSAGHAYMIIHTAGAGGKPRGCVLSQANMLVIGVQMAQMFKLSNRDCHICILPFFHIGGFSMTLSVMHQGGKNLILDRFDPLVVLKLTEKEQGTFFGSFPPILATILDAQDKQSFDTSSLRGVGGIDGPETIQRFLKKNPQAVFYSVYGQTECMPVSGCDIMEKPGSIGLPAVMTRIGIFDDLDREVPVGGQGEICVRSPAVFLGYLNLEADTAHTFRNGWHHTGDLGRIDKDGFIWYVGRKPEKELIKPGGENVYPAEVEKVILEQGDVEMASVIGVPDVQWGEAIKAVCVLKPGRSLEPQALIDFVASKIAHYKKPKYVVFVNSLPKTKEGEIDRDQVKKAHGGKY